MTIPRTSGHDVAIASQRLGEAIEALIVATQQSAAPTQEIAMALGGALASAKQAQRYVLTAIEGMHKHLSERIAERDGN